MSDLFAPLEIQVYKNDYDLYLAISGRLVRNSCSLLEKTVEKYFSSHFDRFLVNMRDVTFADSAGLGLLVSFKVRCSKEKMQFVVLEPSREMTQVLSVSRLDAVFPIIKGEDAVRMREEMEQKERRPRGGAEAPALSEARENETIDRESVGSQVQEDPAQRHPDVRVNELCRLAVEKVRQGDFDQAVELYRQVLQLDPQCLSALNNLALLYEKRPLWIPLAVQTWERVLEAARAASDQKHVLRAEKRLLALKSDPLNALDRLTGDQETIMG